MIEVEKARRLFLANLNKKQEELMTFVNIISDWIEQQASEGMPCVSFDKNSFEDFEPLSDETMMHIATYFKAKGYTVNLKTKVVAEEKEEIGFIIEEVVIAWIDIMSMLDKESLKEQLK